VGQEHHHPQVLNLLLLLHQPKGFCPEAPLEAPVRMHLHLQEHHRPSVAAAGMFARPEHAIGAVGLLLEHQGAEGVGARGGAISRQLR
jgi:hypothetical protein